MKIKIGTRGSRLALAQTSLVERALKSRFPDIETELITFSTLGDKVTDRPIDKIGGKGVFSGEIEAALQSGEIQFAVHSAKDLPIRLGEGLEISGVLERGNYRDLLIMRKSAHIESESVFTVGTGSSRRRLELARHYPSARFADIRGNVDTRLKKLQNGEFDAVILCAAGLERLGISFSDFTVRTFDYADFLPAPCQGIIAIECVSGSSAAELVKHITDRNTMICFETERAIIEALGADCSSPIGAFGEIDGNKIHVILSDKYGKRAEGCAEIEDRLRLVRELTEGI